MKTLYEQEIERLQERVRRQQKFTERLTYVFAVAVIAVFIFICVMRSYEPT